MRRALLGILLAASCWAEPLENRYLYHPVRPLAVEPKTLGLGLQDVYFRTEDGITLNGWWLPPPRDGATVLYFHGNGGNLANTVATLKILRASGLGAFAVDYRGYGRSEGSPSEGGLRADARAAYAECLKRKVTAQRLLIHGQSLGGAVAVQLAATKPCAGLILESTFTSAREIGRKLYGPVAVAALQSRFQSDDAVARVTCPVFVIHGSADELIPDKMGRQLFARAREPKRLWIVPGAGHGTLRRVAGPEFGRRVRDFAAFCLRNSERVVGQRQP